MDTHSGNVGSNKVSVALGDMTKIKADAYIVPQFTSASSFGGVGGAVARAGGTAGLEEYQKFIDARGEQKFATVLLTKSGGGNAKYHLHVASVGSPKQDEFNTVQAGFYNALKTAAQNGIQSIAAPAMGTGIIGQLDASQSARAMLSALEQFTNEGGKMEVSFVIFGDKKAYEAFAQALDTKSYVGADREAGKKEFSVGEWVVGMQRDADANRNADARTGGAPVGAKQPRADSLDMIVRNHNTLPEHTGRPSYLIVKPGDLDRALIAVDKSIRQVYKQVPLDVYTVDFGDGAKLHAIKSGDPKFYMGIGENSALYNLNPPVKNGIFRDDLKQLASKPAYRDLAIEGRDELGTSGKGQGGTQDVKRPDRDQDKRVS